MATRVVEGKKPYTGGKAISIDGNKVISLNLRDENNLIIYDEGDDEIYVDLQLDDEITPTSAFPIGVNVGRVIVDNGWDKPGTIISAETTSGDNIKIFYADEGTLWIDNGTGTFKQIYFKSDVDALLLALRNYIDGELAKKQNGVSSDTAPENPSEGDLWYDTTSSSMKVWDGTAWQSVGTGGGGSDIVYATQAEYNALLPGALTDNKHYFIYEEEVGPTPPSPLPAEYQEVEYIESNSLPYIDTGFVPDGNTEFELDYMVTNNTGYQAYFGSDYDRDNTAFHLVNDRLMGYGNQYLSPSSVISANTRYLFEFKNLSIYIDGNLQHTYTYENFTAPHSALIFAVYRQDYSGTANPAYGKVYSCKIWDDGTLVRDFVPCYRKADSVIGLYDLVNDQFYTNAGTGTFTKGPDVN